ncbi:MAG: flagellar basal body P-ring formation protein FlgA [Deltaproteobacteria bacterium]|jgi:flagella basal body P-ring formation protein FlgA|nr:flagellar basal body P-ring formation protein FlgA [Deltaproteobacteria bacterium]
MIDSKQNTNLHRRLMAKSMVMLMLIVLSGPLDCPGAAQSTVIKVLEAAEVKGPKIYLGEIAKINGDDRQLVEALNELVIAKAPLPSRMRVLETQFIKLRLRQNGFNISTFDICGFPKTNVTRSYTEIGKKEIEEILSDFLYTTALRGNSSARIKSLGVPNRIILPKGHITYRVSPPKDRHYVGLVPLSIEFSVDGEIQKKVRASATIEMMVEVVVARKPLQKHKPITEDDVVLHTMDLADLPGNVFMDPEAVLGKRTRRAIGSNTVLRTDLIELPPIIQRGDIVVVVAESNGLRITALGKAKRKGRLGERIPVENFDSKKILHAEIVDSRTVKIEF